MIGPGKYDELCTLAREAAEAKAAVLILLSGNRGNGFSVQAPPEFTLKLPHVLRDMADQIERDLRWNE